MALSKDEKERGYKMVPQPNKRETEILRRISRGYLLVTRHEGKSDTYSYDDGTAILIERSIRGRSQTCQFDGPALHRFCHNGWIIPIDGESLLNDPLDAQRYRARNASDPPLPKIVGGPRAA